jgi:hypothetical protein
MPRRMPRPPHPRRTGTAVLAVLAVAAAVPFLVPGLRRRLAGVCRCRTRAAVPPGPVTGGEPPLPTRARPAAARERQNGTGTGEPRARHGSPSRSVTPEEMRDAFGAFQREPGPPGDTDTAPPGDSGPRDASEGN